MTQIRHTLDWFIISFHLSGHGPISRRFTLAAHLNMGRRMCIITDASPFGLGGIITLDGVIIGWFACDVTHWDCDLLQVAWGTSNAQQCFEGLAALVALRLWAPLWMNGRCSLEFKSDNMTALVMVANLRARSPGLSLLAQEMALDFALAHMSQMPSRTHLESCT